MLNSQGTSFMTSRINRREFLAGMGLVAAAARSVVGQSPRTRLVLLGIRRRSTGSSLEYQTPPR